MCDCWIVRGGVVVRHGTSVSHHAEGYAAGPLLTVTKHLPWQLSKGWLLGVRQETE